MLVCACWRLILGLVGGLLHVAELLRLGDEPEVLVLLLLALAHGRAREHARVALGLRRADAGLALHLRRALLAEGIDVAVGVVDLLDGEHVDAEADLAQVFGRLSQDLLVELRPVAHDLLDGEPADDGAQVPLEVLVGDSLDFLLGEHAEEALAGGHERGLVAQDFDVAHTLHVHLDAVLVGRAVDVEVDGKDVEVEVGDALDQRELELGAAGHHPEADLGAVRGLPLAAVEDGDPVGWDADVIVGDDAQERDERDHQGDHAQRDHHTLRETAENPVIAHLPRLRAARGLEPHPVGT